MMLVWPSFCAACGQGLRREDKFCSNCGVAVPQQPFESAGTMARPAFSDRPSADQAAPQEALPAPAAEALPAAEASRTAQPAPAAEMVPPAAPPPPEEKTDVSPAFSPVPTAFDYVAPLPTAYDYVEPAVVEKPRRKSRLSGAGDSGSYSADRGSRRCGVDAAILAAGKTRCRSRQRRRNALTRDRPRGAWTCRRLCRDGERHRRYRSGLVSAGR